MCMRACIWVCMRGSLCSTAAGNEGGGGSGDATFRFRISHPNLPGLGLGFIQEGRERERERERGERERFLGTILHKRGTCESAVFTIVL